MRRLSAKDLTGFLREPKNLSDPPFNKKKLPFSGAVALVALIFVGVFWIFSGNNPQVSTMTRELASLERSVSNSPDTPSNGLSVADLGTFLATASNTDLPKRFTMNSLKFQHGTTDILSGSDTDLNLIARNLRRYPKVSVRIEAYIEETGDPDENLLLSENRAMLVREELIGRGIEPSRIRAEGRGPRKDKRQAYLVITKIK